MMRTMADFRKLQSAGAMTTRTLGVRLRKYQQSAKQLVGQPTVSPTKAKASNLATGSRLKGSFRATVLYVAKLATGLLIVRSVGDL